MTYKKGKLHFEMTSSLLKFPSLVYTPQGKVNGTKNRKISVLRKRGRRLAGKKAQNFVLNGVALMQSTFWCRRSMWCEVNRNYVGAPESSN